MKVIHCIIAPLHRWQILLIHLISTWKQTGFGENEKSLLLQQTSIRVRLEYFPSWCRAIATLLRSTPMVTFRKVNMRLDYEKLWNALRWMKAKHFYFNFVGGQKKKGRTLKIHQLTLDTYCFVKTKGFFCPFSFHFRTQGQKSVYDSRYPLNSTATDRELAVCMHSCMHFSHHGMHNV